MFFENRFEKLKNDGFVCDVCGHRYTRPSIWDCIDNMFDEGSFVEHAETKLIIDKDILGFPEYNDKLKSARKRTGLMTSMITGDAKIMGCDIVFCGADFIISGDQHLLRIKEYEGIKILTAAEFLPLISLIKQLAAANPCAPKKSSFSFFTTQSFQDSSGS